MNKKRLSRLLLLRLALDEMITYGTKKDALRIAAEGLRYARVKKVPGECEYFKGQLDLLRNKFICAIEHFDKAITYNPQDGAAFNDRALCMTEIGLIDGALDYFNQGIAVEPDFATIHHNKGWLLNNIGRYTEAIECFNCALDLEPDRAVTYDNLADALFNIGDWCGSIQAYEKVLFLLEENKCRAIRKQIIEKIRHIRLLLEEKGINACNNS